jgi:hypothetical protein
MKQTLKKIQLDVDNLTESEKVRKQLITQIQRFLQEGCSVSETARRLGITRTTAMKYKDGNPDILCRSTGRGGILHQYRDYIITSLQSGLTQSEIIRQLRNKYGYTKSRTLAHMYMENLVKQYKLDICRYKSSEQTTRKRNGAGAIGRCHNYITKKGIFQYLWMNAPIRKVHHEYIWSKYPVLWTLEGCIKEFRAVFSTKSLVRLYLFIEKYKISTIKEVASFASGLEKDITAVENAVASNLSNGFVEGTNNKLKMIKRTMYGRSSRKLLAAKLMYNKKEHNG